MNLLVVAVATVAILALVAIAAVRLKPRVEKAEAAGVIHLYPTPRRHEPALVLPLQGDKPPSGDERLASAERFLGIRGPTIASPAQGSAPPVRYLSGHTGLPSFYSRQPLCIATGISMDPGSEFHFAPVIEVLPGQFRVIHGGVAYRVLGGDSGLWRAYLESTGAQLEMGQRWSEITGMVRDFRESEATEGRRRAWAAGS